MDGEALRAAVQAVDIRAFADHYPGTDTSGIASVYLIGIRRRTLSVRVTVWTHSPAPELRAEFVKTERDRAILRACLDFIDGRDRRP